MKGSLILISKILINIVLIVSIILDGQIVWHEWGTSGLAIAFFIFPVTIFGIPIYSIFRYGRWIPFLVTYGGGIISFGLYLLSGDKDED